MSSVLGSDGRGKANSAQLKHPRLGRGVPWGSCRHASAPHGNIASQAAGGRTRRQRSASSHCRSSRTSTFYREKCPAGATCINATCINSINLHASYQQQIFKPQKNNKRTGAKALARRRTLVELSRVNQRKCAHRRTAHGTATPAATTARSRVVCGSRGAPPPAGAAKSVRPCEGTGKGRPRGPASACGFCGLCGAGCAMPGEAQRRYTRRARVRCACVINPCVCGQLRD